MNSIMNARKTSRLLAVFTVPVALLLLSGCERSLADIEQEKAELKTRASRQSASLNIPQVPEPRDISYQYSDKRSPFAHPEPTYSVSELSEELEGLVQPENCLQPDGQRQRQPLEQYPLDSLVMRGVIGNNRVASGGGLWALIDSGDGNLFRVGAGQYLGLDHGRIQAIDNQGIELIELVPDGTGCWQERMTTLALLTE